VHRSALLGQSLTWRPAWAGLRANAMRVRLVLRLAAGWRQPPAAASSKEYLKNYGRPLYRLSHIKNFFGRRYAEPLAYSASKPAGKIWCGQILPRENRYFKGRKENYRY